MHQIKYSILYLIGLLSKKKRERDWCIKVIIYFCIFSVFLPDYFKGLVLAQIPIVCVQITTDLRVTGSHTPPGQRGLPPGCFLVSLGHL